MIIFIRIISHGSLIPLIILLLCFSSTGWSQNEEDSQTLYYDVLQGSYQVIGRRADSRETYSGSLTLHRTGEAFEVVRIINNKTYKGAGKIETASADRTHVLRVRFTEEGQDYEATYLIATDLDNYGRLSGLVYLKNGRTKSPGIEALFSDHISIK